MREQIEKRIAALKVTLALREDAVVDARKNRDRVAGGIVELEYALEQAEPIAEQELKDDTIKGQIPAAGK